MGDDLDESRDSFPFGVEFPRRATARPGSVRPVDHDFQRAGVNLSAYFAHVAFMMPFLGGQGACVFTTNLTESDIPSGCGPFQFHLFLLHVFPLPAAENRFHHHNPIPGLDS